MLEELEAIERRFEDLLRELAKPEIFGNQSRLQELLKEKASLEDIVCKFRDYKRILGEIEEAETLLREERDPEFHEFLKAEFSQLQERKEKIERELQEALIRKEEREFQEVIMEIRAGVGGEEASLFARDLFRMYTRYALSRGWEVGLISKTETELGGFKEVIFEIKGRGAYERLKHERGVHRVQRVPITEAGDRIHTSTATVAVLRKPSEIEIKLNPEDLRIETFRAGGPGGQHMQKNETAVRVVHIPTGLSVVCRDERSQYQNKMRALEILRARLFEFERRKQEEKLSKERRSQVGTGERAEKVRTYNFPQKRVTDHRIGLTLYNLERILDGELDKILDALALREKGEELKS